MRSGDRSVPSTEATLTGFATSNELDGAACAELHPSVAHKFFDIDFARDVVRRKAAQNICARCVVAPECLQQALHGPGLQPRGVVAGISVGAIRRARSWLAYESGVNEQPPRAVRPHWLPRPEAAETVEQMLVELDDGVER